MGGGLPASASAPTVDTDDTRKALAKLLPKEEGELLRLGDESRRLENELVEIRFKHFAAEEGAAKIEREIRVLDEMIDRSAADRAYLDANGTLPPPGVPPPPVVRHSTVTDATSSQG